MTYQFEISNSVIYSANCHCHLKQCSWELNVISFECRATIWSLEINYTLNLDFSFSLSIFGWICSHTCKREKKRSYCFWISNEWALNHANPVQLLDLRVVWVHLYRNKFGLKCVRFRLCASLFCWMQEVFFIQLVILWRFVWRCGRFQFMNYPNGVNFICAVCFIHPYVS